MTLRRILGFAGSVMLMAGAAHPSQAQVFGTGPFSGLYFGAHGGYGAARDANPTLTGAIGGLQAGLNVQLGAALLGVEGDYTWTNVDGRASTIAAPGVAINTSIDSMWSVRGRLGLVVANSLLLFATAGYGGMDVSASATVSGFTLTGNARYNGFVYGGGAELLLTRNLMLRAEALRFEVDGTGAAAGDNAGATQFRAAISYKF